MTVNGMSVILCHLISYCVISFYAAVVACCRGDTQYFRWLKDSSDRINVPHVAKFDKTTVECNRSQIYIYIFFFNYSKEHTHKVFLVLSC